MFTTLGADGSFLFWHVSTALLDDDVYMKGREMKGTMDARLWLEQSEDFKKVNKSKRQMELWRSFCSRPVTRCDGSRARLFA